MIYIRKIKESSWFMGQAPLDSDSISDLVTSNHELSVWQVPNDKSNLDDIVLALALTRDDTNGIFVVFIKKENIKDEIILMTLSEFKSPNIMSFATPAPSIPMPPTAPMASSI